MKNNDWKKFFALFCLISLSLVMIQCAWLPLPPAEKDLPLPQNVREELRIRIPIGSPTIYINGEETTLTFPPAYINEKGGAMIPLRFISEVIIAEVDWLPETKEIKIERNEKEILMQVNRPYATVNGMIVELSHPVEIREERSFVSLRFIAQQFDFLTDWIPESKTIELIKPY